MTTLEKTAQPTDAAIDAGLRAGRIARADALRDMVAAATNAIADRVAAAGSKKATGLATAER